MAPVPFGTKLVGGIVPLVMILAIMAFFAEYSIRLMLVASEMGKHQGLECNTYGKLGRAAMGKCTTYALFHAVCLC